MALGAPPSVPTHLGGHGWTESSLTKFDQRRVRGLWYATPGGDLHVGGRADTLGEPLAHEWVEQFEDGVGLGWGGDGQYGRLRARGRR